MQFKEGEDVTMEIDSSSLKQYGTSYKELKAPSLKIKPIGRTQLGNEVLNDTFVLFPRVSVNSSFIKRNKYEILMHATEEKRFELDYILEINNHAIKHLTSILKKVLAMSTVERNEFRLDNYLCDSTNLFTVEAIKRIYSSKGNDFVDAMKRYPAVVVPIVLGRLKEKWEEWRRAKVCLEREWRKVVEDNYLKSLDISAVPFKKNDRKKLKTRSLLKEIEELYLERKEVQEDREGSDGSMDQKPHLVFKYDKKSIMKDVAAILTYYVEITTKTKEDKQKMKKIISDFLPNLFFSPDRATSNRGKKVKARKRFTNKKKISYKRREELTRSVRICLKSV